MIRLVLTDLDDTLIPFGVGHTSARANRAIHALLDAGAHFGPVTGRIPASMGTMFCEDEECYRTGAFANGQVVSIDGEVVQRTLIEGALLRRVAGLLDDLCANAWLAIYDSDDLRNVNLVTAHPERIRANPPATWGVSVFGVVSDVEDRGYLKANLQCSCDRDEMTYVRDRLRRSIPELRFVFPSMTAKVIDINPGDWEKGDSVRLIAARLGVSIDEVVVFGDSENDLSMMRAVPNSVAVANADEAVAAAARWHIGDVRDDAVAIALEDIASACARGGVPSFFD